MNPTATPRASTLAPRHLLAIVTATTLLGASAFIGAGESAHALVLPLDPADPVVADMWTSPLARADDQNHEADLEITGFSFTGALEVGEELEVDLQIRNNTADPLDQVTLLAQRRDATTDNAAARVALAADGLDAYPYYGTQLVLDEEIAPGDSTTTTLRIPTDTDEAVTLAITQPGAYPVRIALSGQLDGTASYLDSQRFLLPVTAAPEDPATNPAPVVEAEPEPTPTTVLFPLTADTDVLGGETGEAPEYPALLLGSEDLAAELGADGRLSRLIDAFIASPPAVQQASCVVIDPHLLSVINRMTGGYTVAEQRVSSVSPNQRLRDLWTASNEPTNGTPGRGAADAAIFLEKLRDAVATNCTVAMPWANTDLNAVNATGNQWLLREALRRGTTTIEEVLGVTAMDNVVIPGNGYVDPALAPNLGLADTAGQDLPLEQVWEAEAAPTGPATDPSGQTALDDPSIIPTQTVTPPPQTPVSVLVADNTVWRAPTADRFHHLAPGITAVSYQGSLSATLATLGSAPETVGFANPDSRFDYTLDSTAARTLTGQGAIRLTVDNADPDTPVLIMPTASLDPDDATMILETTADLITSGAAQPFALTDYVSANTQQQNELSDAVAVSATPDSTSFGAPFDDPSAITDTEILRATQQATYIDDLTSIMVNDPGIVLTRYGFTAPLRQDLLRALTLNSRRSHTGHAAATRAADQLLTQNRDALQQLRSSVALLPPGNVYTRTSNSSPLIIVAQNGLPLPAAAQILYAGPGDAQVNTPGVIRIPALGSITLQMTADLPDDNRRTDLTVWLASPDGATISDPVEISVQPRPNIIGAVGIIAVGILILGALLIFRVLKIRRRKDPGGADHHRPARTAGARPTAPGNVRAGRPKASRHVPRGHGRADDGSGSPKPPGSN